MAHMWDAKNEIKEVVKLKLLLAIEIISLPGYK
jgi:hypothetical protein